MAEEAAKSLSTQIEDLQNKMLQLEKKTATGSEPLVFESLDLVDPLRRGEKPRILWVDDFPSNNAIQIVKLTSDCYWIDVASITKQAIEMLKYTKYDLVISDMGRIENGATKPNAGIFLTREIRLTDKEIPIVIYSSQSAIEWHRNEAHEAGAKYVTNSTIDLCRIISVELSKVKDAN